MTATPSPLRRIDSRIEAWRLREAFAFSGQRWTDYRLLICEIEQDGCIGLGEAFGVYYLNETPESMQSQIDKVTSYIEQGIDRQQLLELLPAGGARNAVDCALWDLESKLTGTSAWERAGVARAPALSVFNIGMQDEPEAMAERAAACQDFPLLKIKLGADRPVERVAAIRAARPDARVIVDANQGWTLAELKAIAPALERLGVEMIEQPLPRGADAQLEGYRCPLPLCADESCLDGAELPHIAPWYQRVAIKLDKAGGLTAALATAARAHQLGLNVVGGSMMGTALAMLPTHVLAQHAVFSDLDAPLHSKGDRGPTLRYEQGLGLPPIRGGWGMP